MAKTFTLRLQNNGAGSATSFTTGSISPSAGGILLACFSVRSENLASMSSETLTLSGAGASWSSLQQATYDGDDRMRGGLFLGTGSFSSGGLTIGTTGGTRILDTWQAVVVQITADNALSVIQSAVSAGANVTTRTPTLSAFGNAANACVSFGMVDRTTRDWTADSTPSAHTMLTTATAVVYHCQYLDAEDTSPVVTITAAADLIAFAVEIAEASGGGGIAPLMYHHTRQRRR